MRDQDQAPSPVGYQQVAQAVIAGRICQGKQQHRNRLSQANERCSTQALVSLRISPSTKGRGEGINGFNVEVICRLVQQQLQQQCGRLCAWKEMSCSS